MNDINFRVGVISTEAESYRALDEAGRGGESFNDMGDFGGAFGAGGAGGTTDTVEVEIKDEGGAVDFIEG